MMEKNIKSEANPQTSASLAAPTCSTDVKSFGALNLLNHLPKSKLQHSVIIFNEKYEIIDKAYFKDKLMRIAADRALTGLLYKLYEQNYLRDNLNLSINSFASFNDKEGYVASIIYSFPLKDSIHLSGKEVEIPCLYNQEKNSWEISLDTKNDLKDLIK